MGQFYKTAKPTFSDDFVYQPPWEVLNKVAATKQAKFDGTVAEATALNDLLKIKHIDEGTENEKVATEKEYYESEVQGLTQELQAGGDYTKMMPRIRELQKKIMQSREDGNIAKFEKSAAIQGRHLKAIEDAKKQKDGKGDILGAQAGYNTFMKKWKEQGNRSLDDTLEYEEVLNRPDALNRDKMVEEINKLNPNGKEIIRANPNGKGYIFTQEFKNSGVDVGRIRELILKKIRQDPNINNYFEQRDRFGIAPGVYDRENKKLNIIESIEDIKNKKGDTVDQKVNYHDNELANYVTALDPYAYNETKDSRKYSSDATVLALRKEAATDRRRKEDQEVISVELTNNLGDGTEQTSMWSAALNSNRNSNTYDAGKEAKFNTIWNTISKGAGSTIAKQLPQLKEAMMNGDVQDIQGARAFLFNDKNGSKEDFYKNVGFDPKAQMEQLLIDNGPSLPGVDPQKRAEKIQERAKEAVAKTQKRVDAIYDAYSKGEDIVQLWKKGQLKNVPGLYSDALDNNIEQIGRDMESFQDSYDKSMRTTYTKDVKANSTYFPLNQPNTIVKAKVAAVSKAALTQMRNNSQDFVLYEDGMPVKNQYDKTKQMQLQEVLEKATYVSGYGGSTGDLIGTFNIGYEDDEGVTHEYLLGTKSNNASYLAITKMVKDDLIKPGDALYKQYSNVEFASLEKQLKGQLKSRNSQAVSAPVKEDISGSNLQIQPSTQIAKEGNEQTFTLLGTNTLTGEPQELTELNIGGNVVYLSEIKKNNPERYKELTRARTAKGIYNLLAAFRQKNK
jgi:hypothetical protein